MTPLACVALDGIRSHRLVSARAGVHRSPPGGPAPTFADDPAPGAEGTG
ncbi:hypothetical protein [Streptomyces flavovirens]